MKHDKPMAHYPLATPECARHDAPSTAATLIEQLGSRVATRESPGAA